MSVWEFMVSHRAEIFEATLAHLFLVVVSMAIAISIGVPLGMLLVKQKELRTIALGFASVLQTIPSLALFGFLIPLPFLGGIGTRTAVIALFLYALLPILRNTVVGLTNLDPAVLEAAAAIGAGGLGTFIFRGVAMVSDAVILAGAIPAALLALAADAALGLLERRLKVV